MPNADFFAEGLNPKPTDSEQRSLVKLLATIQAEGTPAHDDAQFFYTGDKLTTVEYRLGGELVATRTLTYDGDLLTRDQLVRAE